MAKIRGPYPGGPRRPAEGEPGHPVVLEGGEEVEARLKEGARQRHERRKRKRILAALVAVVLVALGVGTWLGIRSYRSAREIASEKQRAEEGRRLIEQERQRILQELWRMEALERAPQPRPR
ncbi:MAG: hypothetical protein HY704_07470 [Gemmatimonadetes bacterium]|nr:hypothetical protein [Gemmatimonadota bacterium]